MSRKYQQSKTALGSIATITIIAEPKDVSNEIFNLAWNHLDIFEERFSRFKTTSELTSFNNSAGEWSTVSKKFMAMLKSCIKYSELSGGMFNPYVLPALQKAGYKGSWPSPGLFEPELDHSRRQIVSPENLEINGSMAKIPKNSAIEFGGIGKGFELDELATLLELNHISNYWISLGGDLICSGFDLGAKPWKIAIDSVTDNNDAAIFINKDGKRLALATSAATKRKGKTWHHLINPKTGLPAESNILAASALAKCGKDADVLAKILLIDGGNGNLPESATSLVIDSVLQYKDQSIEITQKEDYLVGN